MKSKIEQALDNLSSIDLIADITPPGPSGSMCYNEAIITRDRKILIARRGTQTSKQWYKDAHAIVDIINYVKELRDRNKLND